MQVRKKLQKIRERPLIAVFAVVVAVFVAYSLWSHAVLPNTTAQTAPRRHHVQTKSQNPAQNTTSLTALSNYSVPILMYHYIRTVTDSHDRLGFNLSVTPDNFDTQMLWLSQNHYHTLSLADYCNKKVVDEGKPIVLTFDDGYDDAFTTALPTLQKYHFIGTFFIVKNFIDKTGYVSSDDLKKMNAAGMELGAHSQNHINLATAPLAKQKEEIEGSKQISPVFAYPAGKYTADTINLVHQAGYICAVTTHSGMANEHSLPYELPRVRVSGSDTLNRFIQNVTAVKHTVQPKLRSTL